MSTVGEQSKNFVKKYRTPLIVGGILIVAGTICRVAYVYYVNKSYVNWFMQGTVVGFQGAIDWFDSEFSDLSLRKLYNNWSEAHPEEILYI